MAAPAQEPAPSGGFEEGITVDTYDDFCNKIKEFEKDPTKLPLFILFEGSNVPGSNVSWCSDCVEFEGIWDEYKKTRRLPAKGYLMRVKVGSKGQWMDKENPYRSQQKLRLRSIPSLMKWGAGMKLDSESIKKPDNIDFIFE